MKVMTPVRRGRRNPDVFARQHVGVMSASPVRWKKIDRSSSLGFRRRDRLEVDPDLLRLAFPYDIQDEFLADRRFVNERPEPGGLEDWGAVDPGDDIPFQKPSAGGGRAGQHVCDH